MYTPRPWKEEPLRFILHEPPDAQTFLFSLKKRKKFLFKSGTADQTFQIKGNRLNFGIPVKFLQLPNLTINLDEDKLLVAYDEICFEGLSSSDFLSSKTTIEELEVLEVVYSQEKQVKPKI
eukprot:TRINITY_DN19870_c0_g1_i1.p1 TRINITY_DN19870_c0_g1~~TRINITY_DN19870_c0_g1_i1.p1  ORF type:complete len:121 (-),score=10.30 TRINITY_DN19870_c0_g1_i1:58-420(-)